MTRITITIVIGLHNLFRNTGDPTIVLLVQINNIIALFTILFVIIVLGKFVQTPPVLRDCNLRARPGHFWHPDPPRYDAALMECHG